MSQIRLADLKPGWIAVPTGVTPRYLDFWEQLMLLVKPGGTGYSRGTHPDNGVARNNATREMMKHAHPEWIYYLDDDHTFSATSLCEKVALLQSRPDIDALAGFYTKKYPPFKSVLFKSVPPGPLNRPTWGELKTAMLRDGLMKVEGCGGGGLLVRRSVINRLYELHPDGHLWENGPKRSYGPDIGFSIKIRDAGFSMWADVKRPLGHTITCTTTPEWDPKLKAWFIIFKFGTKTFKLPVSAFDATPEGTDDGHDH